MLSSELLMHYINLPIGFLKAPRLESVYEGAYLQHVSTDPCPLDGKCYQRVYVYIWWSTCMFRVLLSEHH